ncbi:MAG: TauD/TfdA dioxygenase family protein [Alphaproteobacteria bacterium]
MAIEIKPTDAALGAEVSGIDLSHELKAAAWAAIRNAWHRHLVLLFRGQSLAPGKLAEFSKHFGMLDVVPAWRDFHPEGTPEVLVISNVQESGKAIGVLGYGEAEWHTDMSYMAEPPRASVLHALEVPPSGGNTSFLNMYKVYEELPADLRRAVEGREVNHDSSYDSTGSLRPGAPQVTDVRQAPGARHPLVRRHPDSGRAALYLGRRLNAYVLGLPVEESEALLDRLWAHVLQPKYVWEHRWRVGDVLIWDNRCTMHRREPFDAATRRVMHRTQIKGERPIAA